MNTDLNSTSFSIVIKEYGKEVIKYSDINRERFLKRSQEIIREHIEKFSNQKGNEEIKNVTIHYYTY